MTAHTYYMTFEQLELIEPIRKALKKEKYTTPTPIQAEAIPVVLDGSDLLGCAQTGTGKTAAFSIPIIQKIEERISRVILLPLANPSAFYAGAKQVVPEDGVNLNRAFPGNSAGPLSARLAFALEAALYPEADLLADLHSGDCSETLHPLVFFPAAGKKMVFQQ